MKIEKIFVIHYYAAKDRKTYLDSFLPKLGIPFEYRSLINRDSPEIYETKYFDMSEDNKNKRNNILEKFGFHVPSGLILEGDSINILRHKAIRAATLEHFKTYEHIFNETNLDNVLIFEDDVCFKDDFLCKFYQLEESIPENFDVCYIGSGCGLQLPYSTENFFGLHPKHQSKCSDSYIVNRKSIKKIIDNILPFYAAIDWDLNYVQQLLKMNVYWATNPLVYQGSQQGNYSSSLNFN